MKPGALSQWNVIGRRLLGFFAAWMFPLVTAAADFRISTFSVDVTIPPGHPCMGGGIAPAKELGDPLFAKGFVLTGGEMPLVLVSFDWCEIRGTSFDKWKAALAASAGTDAQRVLVTSTHVHDAPVMDEDAEKMLRAVEATGAWKGLPKPEPSAAVQEASVCHPAFNDACIARVCEALKQALLDSRRVTHVGTGRSKVERIASNRRFITSSGAVSYGRYSSSADKEAREAGEGEIDPWLRTVSFWDGEKPLCALHGYAVHPMSSYGKGRVSADFPGQARALMQAAHPEALHIYTTGCAGNVTAGKYNTGGPESRQELAARLHAAMERAWMDTRLSPMTRLDFKMSLMPLGARATPRHTEEVLLSHLKEGVRPFQRSEAAMGLAWYARVRRGHQVEVPKFEFEGGPVLLLLPAEAYVEFQLFAQALRPDSFMFVMGYGECGPGYVPVERAFKENDGNLNGWAWTPPGSQAVMERAIREVLR